MIKIDSEYVFAYNEDIRLSYFCLLEFQKKVNWKMEVNYNETKKSKFRFDRYQSTVVMPNLNYDVPRNVPQNVSQDNMEDQIISLIQKNNKISTEKMAMILGVSSKTVKRRIKEMERVNYIGRGSNGHWEISEEG